MKKYFLLSILILQVIIFMTIDDHLNRKKEEKRDNFKRNVSKLLGDKKKVVITASELTDFSWEKVCFQRIDSYFTFPGEKFKDFIEVTFLSSDSNTVFELSYEDYYVEESYVEGSLEGKCVTSKDRIMLKNFGHSRVVFSEIKK